MIYPWEIEKRTEELRRALAEAEATLSQDPAEILFFDTAHVAQALATKQAVEFQIGEYERRYGSVDERAQRRQEEQELRVEAQRRQEEEEAAEVRRFLEAMQTDPELRREVERRNLRDRHVGAGYGPLPGGYPDRLRKLVPRG